MAYRARAQTWHAARDRAAIALGVDALSLLDETIMPLQPNVAGLVQTFNVGPLTVTRRAAPTVNAYGGSDDGAASSVTLNPVAIHPVTGRDLVQVPEAHRNRETVRVYTTVRLYVGDGGQAADTISYRGRTWRVVNTEDNELQGGVYLSLAVLEDP